MLTDIQLVADLDNFDVQMQGIDDAGSGVMNVLRSIPGLFKRLLHEVNNLGTQLRERLEETRQTISGYSVTIQGKFQELDSKANGMQSQVSNEIKDTKDKAGKLEAQVNDRLNDISGRMTHAEGVFKDLTDNVLGLRDQAGAKIGELESALASVASSGTKPLVSTAIHGLELRLSAVEAAGVNSKIAELKTLVDNVVKAGGNAGGHPGGRRSILEKRVFQGLKTLGNDTSGFRMWHDKMVNAFA